MIRWPRLTSMTMRKRQIRSADPLQSRRARLMWTVGNLLMLFGVVVLLYVGGLYATDEYGRYAARGDSDVPAPEAVEDQIDAEPAPFIAPLPAQPAPQAANGSAPAVSAPSATEPHDARLGLPAQAPTVQRAQISRLVIPSIKLDSKVVEVGWDMVDENGVQVPVWQVAKYAVGQHHGSANPGGGDNIVLAGHVGGYGHVFRDLFYVHPGDDITLYSDGKEHRYIVKERLIVTEEGVPPEQRAENAKLIQPTGIEEVTMVTCWPATGPDKFTQRVVVRALPAEPSAQ